MAEPKIVVLHDKEYEVHRDGDEIWAWPHGWDGIGYLFRPGDVGRAWAEAALDG